MSAPFCSSNSAIANGFLFSGTRPDGEVDRGGVEVEVAARRFDIDADGE
jgi:hypothetical protein